MSSAVLVFADGFSMHNGDVGWGWMVAMMLGMVVFWGAIILGVVWLIRGGLSHAPSSQTPDEVLAHRLADGSISVEEYEQRREALKRGPQSNEQT